jgi:hypothetical protein
MISARDILDSDVWGKVNDELQNECWDKFQSTQPERIDELKALALRLWALREVRSELERRLTKAAERQSLNRSAINDH